MDNYNEKKTKILIEVSSIFKELMGNSIDIDIHTQKSDIAEWDSINHLNLIVELEDRFNLGLTMEQIEDMNSIEKIIEMILLKLK